MAEDMNWVRGGLRPPSEGRTPLQTGKAGHMVLTNVKLQEVRCCRLILANKSLEGLIGPKNKTFYWMLTFLQRVR